MQTPLVFSITIQKKNLSVENDLSIYKPHNMYFIWIVWLFLSKNLNIYYYFFSFINDENYRRVIFNFAKAVLTDVNYVTINSAQKSIIKKCNFHKFKDPIVYLPKLHNWRKILSNFYCSSTIFFSFLEHSDLSKSERYNHAYAVCNIYAFEAKKNPKPYNFLKILYKFNRFIRWDSYFRSSFT